MDTVRRRFVVTGRVQGVFFRATTRRAARDADLTGWVRNRPDGSVEGEVQGPPNRVTDFVEVLHDGSRYARVTDVEVTEIELVTDEGDFEIRG